MNCLNIQMVDQYFAFVMHFARDNNIAASIYGLFLSMYLSYLPDGFELKSVLVCVWCVFLSQCNNQ